MGYIQIPKLVSGGDEPIINVRDMPQEWEYFKTLKESNKDQAYLLFTGASGLFVLNNLTAPCTITVYGGSDGRQKLYRCDFVSAYANRKWYHWDSTQNDWVENATQPSIQTQLDFKEMDKDNFPYPAGLRLWNLQGKQVTNDPHLGTTQLITVIIHKTDDTYATGNVINPLSYGGVSAASGGHIPVVAYSGCTLGLASSSAELHDLEFVDFTYNNGFLNYAIGNAYSLGKVDLSIAPILNSNLLQISYGLQEVKLSNSLTSIPTKCFLTDNNLRKINFPTSLTAIQESAFTGCSMLPKAELPSTVSSIEKSAFSGCSSIKEFTIPTSLTTISESMLSDCTSLEKVVMHNNITSIGLGAFTNCYVLEDFTLPASVTTVGNNAFQNCYRLNNLDLSHITNLGENAFQNCYALKKIVLSNTITTLPASCFAGCWNVEEITLPNALTVINSSALSNLRSIKELNLPNTLQTINSYGIGTCKNLTKLIIPASVISIGNYGLTSNGSMLYYKFLGAPPTLSAANAFATNNSYMKLLIPYEYIANYKTATNWSSSTNQLKARQKGYKTFNQGDTLPSTDSTGNYTLNWYENPNDVLGTTATGSPTASPITVAPYDGEFLCTITG